MHDDRVDEGHRRRARGRQPDHGRRGRGDSRRGAPDRAERATVPCRHDRRRDFYQRAAGGPRGSWSCWCVAWSNCRHGDWRSSNPSLRIEGDDVPFAFSNKMSPHQHGINDLLATLRPAGRRAWPRGGARCGRRACIALGMELSPEVTAVLPELSARVVAGQATTERHRREACSHVPRHPGSRSTCRGLLCDGRCPGDEPADPRGPARASRSSRATTCSRTCGGSRFGAFPREDAEESYRPARRKVNDAMS